jgi:hypothetical protein
MLDSETPAPTVPAPTVPVTESHSLESLLAAAIEEQNRLEKELLAKTKECADLELANSPVKFKEKIFFILIGAIALIVTAIVSVALYIGVHNGKFPDLGPLHDFFELSVELLKIITNA